MPLVMISVRSCPARPTNGSPLRSSSSPGPSPTNIRRRRGCRRRRRGSCDRWRACSAGSRRSARGPRAALAVDRRIAPARRRWRRSALAAAGCCAAARGEALGERSLRLFDEGAEPEARAPQSLLRGRFRHCSVRLSCLARPRWRRRARLRSAGPACLGPGDPPVSRLAGPADLSTLPEPYKKCCADNAGRTSTDRSPPTSCRPSGTPARLHPLPLLARRLAGRRRRAHARGTAFAYGYLSHLAATSTRTTTSFPCSSSSAFRARALRHIYWEARFDATRGRRSLACSAGSRPALPRLRRAGRARRRADAVLVPHQQADLRLGDGAAAARAVAAHGAPPRGALALPLPPSEVDTFNGLCVDAIQDLLAPRRAAAVMRPTRPATRACAGRKEVRRKLRELQRRQVPIDRHPAALSAASSWHAARAGCPSRAAPEWPARIRAARSRRARPSALRLRSRLAHSRHPIHRARSATSSLSQQRQRLRLALGVDQPHHVGVDAEAGVRRR